MIAMVDRPAVATCDRCGTLPPRNRWGASLPKQSPASLRPSPIRDADGEVVDYIDHIDTTLMLHPWLRGTRLGALAENLRGGAVMGA